MSKKILISVLTAILALNLSVSVSFASEQTGTMGTGGTGTGISTGISGVVVASPTFSPSAGSYTSAQSVSMTAASSTAICYRTDGSDPACLTSTTCAAGSTLYSSAISISSSTTFKALSCYPGDGGTIASSSVATAAYTITTTVSSPGGGGGGLVSTTKDPSITFNAPVSIGSTKGINETVKCTIKDTNTSKPGLKSDTAIMKINGTAVAATKTITSYSNSDPVNGVPLIIELVYTPDSSSYYAAGSTVTASCEAENNNILTDINEISFHVGSELATVTPTTEGEVLGVVHERPFDDIAGHWASGYIEKLSTACGVDGYKDAAGNLLYEFRPENKITRAELTKMLVGCDYKDLMVPETKPFPDVALNQWYTPAIAKAKELKWVEGYADGSFRPNININRAEALKIILLSKFAEEDVKGGEVNFTDVDNSAWYAKYVAYAVLNSYVSGYADATGKPTGLFGPNNDITRAEVAKIIVGVKGY